MKFDDEHLMNQALNTHVKEVEVLYWILEDAVYKNQSEKARSILVMILYIAKFRPELIQEGLQRPYRERLKVLSHEILENCSIQKREAISIRQPIQPRKIPFKLESELKDYLIKNADKLCEALRDRIKVTGSEVETEGDYRCDIVAESDETLYAIELKIAQGNHAVVSQCSKYCYYFYRKLRYDRFKKVQGVVIANGFDQWSINELRREGHWIYEILPQDEGIDLARVESISPANGNVTNADGG
jgi:RecB family endonuclease NucS